MQVHHVYDDAGRETAVIIPIQDWRDILRRLQDEPNAETIAAMEECRSPELLKAYASPKDLWAELDAE